LRQSRLTIAHSIENENIRCDLQFNDLHAVATFSSPLRQQDIDQIRWLIEERPRLLSSTAGEVAERIRARVMEIGAELGQAIFSLSSEALAIARAMRDMAGKFEVRVIETPACCWIPWESMLPPGLDRPLSCAAASFVRCRPAHMTTLPRDMNFRLPDAELRILLIVARPAGAADVPFRSVASRIVRAVAHSSESRIRVDVLRPPTFAALKVALARAAAKEFPYQIVHFDGHGEFRESPFSPGIKRGYLLFENDDGTADHVDGEQVGEALVENRVRMLFLNACRSADAGTDGAREGLIPFESVAGNVHSVGVTAVLAMGFDVYVVTAAALAADVYAALASGRTLGEAATVARQNLFDATKKLDWMIPVVFEAEPVRFVNYRDDVPGLPVGPNAATPETEFFLDPDTDDGPRSAKRPFVGYDDVLLELERAFRKHNVVEIIGLTGSGKSAVAAEFARWMAWTQGPIVSCETEEVSSNDLLSAAAKRLSGRLAVMAIDVSKCSDLHGLLAEAERRVRLLAGSQESATVSNSDLKEILRRTSCQLNIFWLFDNADALIAEDNETARAVRELATGKSKVLLAARTSCGLPEVPTIPLPGLDEGAMNDLGVAYHLPTSIDQDALAVWLDWAQGLPSLVLAVLRGVENRSEDALLEARKEIRNIQLGDAPGGKLASACGISKLMPGDFSDDRMLITLYLFQGFLASAHWFLYSSHYKMMFDLSAEQDLGIDRYKWDQLNLELKRAARRGLVCAVDADWLMIHPLAPFAVTPHFYQLCAKMAGPSASDRDLRLMVGQLEGIFCQDLLPPRIFRDLAQRVSPALQPRASRQNLLFAANLMIENGYWESIRVLRWVRDELRSLSREREWLQMLDEAKGLFFKSPPCEDQAPLENPTLSFAKLLAEEAEFAGDSDVARELQKWIDEVTSREQVSGGQPPLSTFNVNSMPGQETRFSFDDSRPGEKHGITTTPQDASQDPNLGAIREISALLGHAKRIADEDAFAALQAAERARQIAFETNDQFRMGEAEVAIAKIYGNVAAVRDLRKREEHARRAVAAGEASGQEDLIARAKTIVGNAIVEQLFESPAEASIERKREAAAAFNFAMRKAKEWNTRAAAMNGFGQLLAFENNLNEAAQQFLGAAQEFASHKDWSSAAEAYANASRAYTEASRLKDAASAATEGLQMLSYLKEPPQAILELLKGIQRAIG
jgi:CHAT domain